MSNDKNENSKKQNSNSNIKGKVEKILDHQRQEIENASSHLSDEILKKVLIHHTNTNNNY